MAYLHNIRITVDINEIYMGNGSYEILPEAHKNYLKEKSAGMLYKEAGNLKRLVHIPGLPYCSNFRSMDFDTEHISGILLT